MSNAAQQRPWKAIGWLGLWAVSVICLSTGCSKSDDSTENGGSSKYEVADDKAAAALAATDDAQSGESVAADVATGTPMGTEGDAPGQPPPLSVNQLESITVPDGTPAELLTFVNQMGNKIMALRAETGGRSEGAAKTREIELLHAIATASDKVLVASGATYDERKVAIENKAGAMSLLSRLEPEKDWVSEVREFAATLASDKDPAIAIEGKSILFGVFLGEFMQGRSKDIQGLMTQLRSLLQEEARSSVVLEVAVQAMNTLVSLGYDSEGREALDLIVAAFKDSSDPRLAEETARLMEQSLFMDAEVEPKFSAVVANREGAEEAFVTELTKILAQPTPGFVTLEKGARYIGVLQQNGDYELARKLCQMYQATYATNTDEELKQGADQLVQLSLRRLDLLGKPLVVEARRLDGVSLDFSQYKGKTVLLVFFGAFDPGCQQELIGLKSLYASYHEQGFDVVGISVDPNPEVLKQFIEQAQIPWMTVTNNKLAEQCGADMLPFGVLIDTTGNVVDIFAQGSKLRKKLEALYGAASTVDPPAAKVLTPSGDQSQYAPLRPIEAQRGGFVAIGLPADAPTGLVAVPASGDTAEQEPAEQETVEQETAEQETVEDASALALEEAEEAVNPYLAREDLSPQKLVQFLFDMQEKPKSIRRRAGFTEAIIEAADRVLQSEAKANYLLIAAEVKLETLHEVACLGDDKADQQLSALVVQWAGDPRPEIARRIEFLQLERRALEVDTLELQGVPALLADLQRYFEAQPKLTQRHLRIASAAVHAINRLEDDSEREQQFTQFGNLFVKSEDRQLARYGKKLSQGGKGRASDLVGKPLELEGITDFGVPLDWSSYRGKIVLVDFWATWCGPCLREMPQVQALYEEISANGFDVVAVSLDEDLEALAEYLAENKVPWANLVGQSARDLATKYEVRGIPTMMLVDQQGNVVVVGNKVEELRPQIKKLLGSPQP